MDELDKLIALIEFIVMALLVCAGLLAALMIVVSLLPKDNILRLLLTAVAKRLALMLGMTAVAVGFEWVPLIDVLLDVATLAVSAWYWGTLLWEARDILSDRRTSNPPQPARRETTAIAPALPAAAGLVEHEEV